MDEQRGADETGVVAQLGGYDAQVLAIRGHGVALDHREHRVPQSRADVAGATPDDHDRGVEEMEQAANADAQRLASLRDELLGQRIAGLGSLRDVHCAQLALDLAQ